MTVEVGIVKSNAPDMPIHEKYTIEGVTIQEAEDMLNTDDYSIWRLEKDEKGDARLYIVRLKPGTKEGSKSVFNERLTVYATSNYMGIKNKKPQ